MPDLVDDAGAEHRAVAVISRYGVSARTATTPVVMTSLTYACMASVSLAAARPGRDITHLSRCQRSRTLHSDLVRS
jgi:hypothetical protein